MNLKLFLLRGKICIEIKEFKKFTCAIIFVLAFFVSAQERGTFTDSRNGKTYRTVTAYDDASVYRGSYYKSDGFSVRCVKD